MEQRDDASEHNLLKQKIENQRTALESLYQSNLKHYFSNLPTLQEAELLKAICGKAKIRFTPASHTKKIGNQVDNCILEILEGKNIALNKDKLKRLRAKDRQNMPYKTTHMAGMGVATLGFSLLIAAAIVFALMGLPAGLVFFLPLLIVGVVSLVAGAGLIKKGMMDNDKLLAKAWSLAEPNEKENMYIDTFRLNSIDSFINSIEDPAVERILEVANTRYLPSKLDAQWSNYSPPLARPQEKLAYVGRKVSSSTPNSPRQARSSSHHGSQTPKLRFTVRSRTNSPTQPRDESSLLDSPPPLSNPARQELPGSSQLRNSPAPQ